MRLHLIQICVQVLRGEGPVGGVCAGCQDGGGGHPGHVDRAPGAAPQAI